MQSAFDYLSLLLNSEQIIRVGGLSLITLIVFAETGLFFAFFLPGDYLLFLAGLLCATGVLPVPLALLMGCIFSAAVLGNVVGFLFGRFLGHKLETMRESFFYKKEYVRNTEKSFEKYGGRALIVGRFLPVVRTFAPIIAGATRFRPGVFLLYNMAGAALWVSILVLAGYYLGSQYPQIIHYIHYIILAFIAFTSLVLVRTFVHLRKNGPSKPGKVADIDPTYEPEQEQQG